MELQKEKLQAQFYFELMKAMISITTTQKVQDIVPANPTNVILADPVKEVIPEKIDVPEEVKAHVNFIEESKHDSQRDLAYERFKKERLVDQNYFIINTKKLACTTE